VQLYKKVDRGNVIQFIPISVPKKEETYVKSLISRNKQIDDLALYLSTRIPGKSWGEIAAEIINLDYMNLVHSTESHIEKEGE